jgi:hypothetical protein
MSILIVDTHKSISIVIDTDDQVRYSILRRLFKRYETLDETFIFHDTEDAHFSKNYLTKIPDTIIDLVLAEDYKIINSRIWVKMKPPVKNTDVIVTLPENSSLDQFSLDIKDLDEVIVIQGDYFTRVYKDDADPCASR